MALDLRGFENEPTEANGLNQLANTLRQQKVEQRQSMLDERRFQQEQEGKKLATSKFLTDYLDPKDHLTGTAYDPQIVSGLQNLLQQGQQLASKGADTNSILMALGPQVAKLNQYSTTAKQINDQIKASVQKLKPYAGYNTEAIADVAQKLAFYGGIGNTKLKDAGSIDPSTNWVEEAVKNHPELVTTGKGLDDFVLKTPLNENSLNGTTAYAGRSQQHVFDAKFHDWMTPVKDAQGNIATDENGMALPMQVKGTPMLDDQNKPIINPQTGKPYIAMDKNYFNLIMRHNPDIADFISGEVNKAFREAGAKEIPPMHSPQWDMMARHVLADELQSRDHSALKIRNTEKESSQAIKIDIGNNRDMLDATARYEEALKLKGQYSYLDPKSGKQQKTNVVDALANIANNNPDYLQGEQTNIAGRNVIDVTPYFPGGGLKSGRGEAEAYKQIYYDPNSRSFLVSTEPKVKDAQGNKPIHTEEVAEPDMLRFAMKIAGANNLNPTLARKIMTDNGYDSGKFTYPSDYGQVASQRIKSEQTEKIDNALKTDSWSSLQNLPTKDGPVAEVVQRSGWQLGADKYAVYTKDEKGNKKKTFTTDDKAELEKYLKSGGAQTQKAPTTPTKGASGIQWQ